MYTFFLIFDLRKFSNLRAALGNEIFDGFFHSSDREV